MDAAESIVREVQSASRVASDLRSPCCGSSMCAQSSALQKDVALHLMLTGNTREANSSHCPLEVGNPVSGFNLLNKLGSWNDFGVWAKRRLLRSLGMCGLRTHS